MNPIQHIEKHDAKVRATKANGGAVPKKDRDFHADGTMTAAAFKRRFMNKAARLRAFEAVDVRSNLGVMKNVTKDKKRLRNSIMRSEPLPGDYYNVKQAAAAKAGTYMAPLKRSSASSHIRSSF